MPRTRGSPRTIEVNRAPVLTLWAAVVAERLGFRRDEALTLGRAVAGLNAYAKGVALGLFAPTPRKLREERKRLRARETLAVDLLGRAVPAVRTPDGLRALAKGRPIDPASVDRYLAGKLGDAYAEVRSAMAALARSRRAGVLAAEAYALYEEFRPAVPRGAKGWGAKGVLDLDAIRDLAR
jgi:hypothetical protein